MFWVTIRKPILSSLPACIGGPKVEWRMVPLGCLLGVSGAGSRAGASTTGGGGEGTAGAAAAATGALPELEREAVSEC